MQPGLAKKNILGTPFPSGSSLFEWELRFGFQKLSGDPTAKELNDMMAFPYCGINAHAPPIRKMSGVQLVTKRAGDDTIYILEGMNKPEKDERVSGRKLFKKEQGKVAEP